MRHKSLVAEVYMGSFDAPGSSPVQNADLAAVSRGSPPDPGR
jgi:hypothetical protein